MDLMGEVWRGLDQKARDDAGTYVQEMMANVDDQREKLQREVERWCQEREQ
jgi:indoleamine 2,3-dioxygenase